MPLNTALQAAHDEIARTIPDLGPGVDEYHHLTYCIGDDRELLVKQAPDDDNYGLFVWDRRRGNHWTITATSFRTCKQNIPLLRLAQAIHATLADADRNPMTAAESNALTSDPWFTRLKRSLQTPR